MNSGLDPLNNVQRALLYCTMYSMFVLALVRRDGTLWYTTTLHLYHVAFSVISPQCSPHAGGDNNQPRKRFWSFTGAVHHRLVPERTMRYIDKGIIVFGRILPIPLIIFDRQQAGCRQIFDRHERQFANQQPILKETIVPPILMNL